LGTRNFLIGFLDRFRHGGLLGSSGLLRANDGRCLLQGSRSAIPAVVTLLHDVAELGQCVAGARLDLGPQHGLLGLELELEKPMLISGICQIKA